MFLKRFPSRGCSTSSPFGSLEVKSHIRKAGQRRWDPAALEKLLPEAGVASVIFSRRLMILSDFSHPSGQVSLYLPSTGIMTARQRSAQSQQGQQA
jgi:hypothetical protein